MKLSAEKLTPKQEAALLALLDNSTIEAAYKAAGISKATMWRFMQDANFQARYRAARRQVVETAIAQLQQDCGMSIESRIKKLETAARAAAILW